MNKWGFMKNKMKVQLRGGFSDRNGIKKENVDMQYIDFDLRTRIALVNRTNVILNYYFDDPSDYDERVKNIVYSLLSDVYGQEVNYASVYSYEKVMDLMYETIRSDSYDAILTVIEFFAQKIEKNTYNNEVYSVYNRIFEEEYMGYRFVNKLITPITDENEIEAINEATNIEYISVRNHIDKALHYLSDRDKPDYENSIKESISAVEAMCVTILGEKATLGAALKQLEKKGLILHHGLKSAFEKLYGYTSDAAGIRHAGDIGGKDSTFDEAKFMMISCCAFINYLKGAMSD